MTTLLDEYNDEIIEHTTEFTIPEDEKIFTTEKEIIDSTIEILTTDENFEDITEVTLPEDEKILTTEKEIKDSTIEISTTGKEIIDNEDISTVIIDHGTETIDSSKEVYIEFYYDISLNK